MIKPEEITRYQTTEGWMPTADKKAMVKHILFPYEDALSDREIFEYPAIVPLKDGKPMPDQEVNTIFVTDVLPEAKNAFIDFLSKTPNARYYSNNPRITTCLPGYVIVNE